MRHAIPFVALATSSLFPAPAAAQLSMSTLGSPVTEVFTGFRGAGFAPSPASGQLDSNAWLVTGLSDGPMTFGDTRTTGDFARGASTGGVSTGGIYAFEIAPGNYALGAQPTASDFSPGAILLRARNDTATTVTAVGVAVVGAALNDGDRASQVSFSFSTDGVTFSSLGLPFTTPAASDASPTWISVPFRGTAGPLSIPPGGFFYLRVDAVDAGGSGSGDELALDTVSLRPTTPGACTADADCDDMNDCSIDSCAGGTCSYGVVPSGTSCDDRDACTLVSVCVVTSMFGWCASGSPMTCDDGNPCTYDACDPTAGCFAMPGPTGASCADGNVCNGDEVCDSAGGCGVGAPLVCDDMNACTADSCDPTSGCANAPVAAGTSCADGDICNGDETCDASGSCVAGVASDCDDMNSCTADSCDAASGCANDPVAAGMPCDDGDICNGEETCDGAGACQVGTALDCDDGDDCTTDTCDATIGCENAPIPMCTGVDGGVMADGGIAMTDGSISMTDGGPPDGSDDGGCSCRASRPSSAHPWWLAALAGAVLWSRWRRGW